MFSFLRELYSDLFFNSPPEQPKTYSVQIAIYKSPGDPPEIEILSSKSLYDIINTSSDFIFSVIQKQEGKIPYLAIREIVENLLHADFRDVVVSILNNGNLLRIADHGSGIKDKEKAFQHGYSTATSNIKKYIRGVGSGLPLAREAMEKIGGTLLVEDNLQSGTVVTLSTEPKDKNKKIASEEVAVSKNTETLKVTPRRAKNRDASNLSARQKSILSLFEKISETGPSTVSQELNLSLATAYRELIQLEKFELIYTNDKGKRELTEKGKEMLKQHA